MGLEFLYKLQIIRESTPEVVILTIQYLTDIVASVIPAVLIAVVYWCYEKNAGKRMVLAFVTAGAFSNFLKICICRSRPWVLDSRLHIAPSAKSGATGYSTPSGHATSAGSLSTSLAVECKKRVVTVVCILYILLTAFARMFLGAHTPVDVTFGTVVGVLFVFIMNKVLVIVDKRKNGDILLLLISCAVFVAGVLFTMLKSYPMHYDASGALLENPEELRMDAIKALSMFLGVVAGIVFEKRCVNFSVDIGIKFKIWRVIIGVVLTLIVYVVLGPAIDAVFGSFVEALLKRALAFFTAIGLAPWVFVQIEKRFNK